MRQLKYNHFLSLFAFTVICITACTKDLTDIRIVYENDFNNSDPKGIVTAGWLNDYTFGTFPFNKITTYQNQKMFGVFNNTRMDLHVGNLPPHSIIKVEFDLYIHDSWRNDLWKMVFDGQHRLLTGFSNFTNIEQAYPNWLNVGTTFPQGNQAQEIFLPGICSLEKSTRGTSKYKIVHTMLHQSIGFDLTLSDAGGGKNDTCARSWAIDNLRIITLKN